ncbi:winged helix-turn-helix transcriptional regulator [Gordonia shandongensis]|uniref:winged helix-turn-helix transcriptional regulator n=1 Tax=Gordonia shandongensis TaxID=376351 RepID=UPI000478DC71|nr:response regulator transcription factor [Gordonia shandongensis]
MDLLLLTDERSPDAVLASLALLPHRVDLLPATTASLVRLGDAEIVVVDARLDLAAGRALCRLVSDVEGTRVMAVVTEGGLVAVHADWGVDDFVLPGTGPAELDARVRLIATRTRAAGDDEPDQVILGELVIDESTYTARLRGRPIDLTYKEFELLKFLAQNAGRVFTRAQLLHEVWGYDYFGGTRTVDVHVRRLRAKLGSDHESLIGTVRNVGYKAVRPAKRADRDPAADIPDADAAEMDAEMDTVGLDD